MIYFVIGISVYISLMVFCYKLGKKRLERAVDKTDFGKVWNFLCDLANSCLGVSPVYVVSRIGRWIDEDGVNGE